MKRLFAYLVALSVLGLGASMSPITRDYKSECKSKKSESSKACKDRYGKDHDRGGRDECNKGWKRDYDDCIKKGKEEHDHDHDHDHR